MKEDLKVTNGKKWVSRQFYKAGKAVGEEESDERILLVDTFETEPAYVKASMGMTINLGNYESLRIDAGVTIPCYKEEIAQAHEQAYQIVMTELFSRVAEAKKMV